jgi:O-antigen ligase
VQSITDRRSWALPAGLLTLGFGVGLVAGVDPRLGLAAAMGLAFMTIVLADLTVGLCMYALLAFLNIVPEVGGSFVSFDKVAGGLLALSWMGAVVNRKRDRRAFVAAHPMFFGVLVFFLVWVVLSLGWSEAPSHGFESAARYLLNALLFLIVFTAIRNRQHVVWLLSAFVAASTLSAMYGLVVPPPPDNEGRLAGSLGEPNELAAVLVAGMILAVALAVIARRRPLTRFALIVAAALSLVCNFLTLSRGGLVALAVAMVAAIAIGGRWRPQALAVAGSTLACLLVFFGFVASTEQVGRVTEVGGGSGRSDIWTVAWRMVEDNTATGVGVGQFQASAVHYLIAPGSLPRADLIIDAPHVAHNLYLQVWTELGLVGLIPFLCILGFPLLCALRAAHVFERSGDTDMEIVSRAVFVGLVGILTADFFLSAQFSKQLWLLLGLGPALLSIATRPPKRAASDPEPTVVSPLAPQRLEPVPALPTGLPSRA